MLRIIGSIAALPFILFFYKVIVHYYRKWQYERKAAELGCQVTALRPYKYIGGVDMITRAFRHDKMHTLPTMFEEICFKEMSNDTFHQYFFGDLLLFTSNPENLQTMLAKKFDDFELGEVRRANFWPFLGNGIFTADGKDWSHSRALLRPQFARNQVSDLELEERHVQDLLRHLSTDATSKWTPEVNLQPAFFRLTLDSATEFLFGESVHSQITTLPAYARTEKDNIANATGLDLVEVGKAFDRATHALGKRARFAENYWLYNPKEFRDDCTLIHKFVDFFVQRALSTDLEKATADEKYVFANELAKATRDPIEIRSQLLNIFLAGRDTTAGLLGWVFWILARHPEIFSKLRASIISEFGTYSNPQNITFATLKSCTYLQHVMSEVLRLYPSVPINSRRAARDTVLPTGGGPDGKSPVFVPKGVQVDYSVQVMHRRPEIWGPDAHEFKPERWVGRKVGWEFLPFNGGPRICLGQQFALTEAGYVIVRLLQRFDAIENLGETTEAEPQYQYSVTTAPWECKVRMREASE